MWVYVQNRFVPEKQSYVSVFDRGFLYGDGLFETVRAYHDTIFLLSRHLNRLAEAADQLAIPLPKIKKLETLLYDTLCRNHLQNALLRLTLTRGKGYGIDPAHGKNPTLIIFARSFTGYPKRLYRRGITCGMVSVRSSNLQEIFGGRLKSANFLVSVLAKQEAVQRGMLEPILFNARGYLAESSTSNLFWVRRGRLYTPDLGTGILAGITRGVVLELADTLKISVREGFYRQDALLNADEAFLTSTGFELMPVVQVEERKIGTGRPGPITRKIHCAFRQMIQHQRQAGLRSPSRKRR